ncbi:right-handed parallel beta-helix repeat-containing protein [Mesonia aestuariivivens]|uniref:Right-handed parallel beta-helix repeat-containing protein n=1 Tax=Mesonia aestuariivivens TaxID=2796128 RepID=A0ABS6W2K0_9FLAO|nr:right-handed parallel beta-helix repeat-containing protein [Mesonia aestuariivivens]MBW2961757.1 right-handed parallel beta-helix repeat-containing protein [Mesonia aestuariivivens]
MRISNLIKFKLCLLAILAILSSCESVDDNYSDGSVWSGYQDPDEPTQPIAVNVNSAEGLRDALLAANAGDSIIVAAGNYEFSAPLSVLASGTENEPIVVMAQGERPLLDFSVMEENASNRGFNLDQDYWKIKGIIIEGAGDNGMVISGSNNIIEFCDFRRNKDTGLQIGNGGANNLILNCDSYFNADSSIENADGFACKLDAGTGNKFEGCRTWNNLDDGWDGYLRDNDNITTTYMNCWAINNGYLEDGTPGLGDGNGFKTGGSDDKDLSHNALYIRCLAVGNIYDGFDHNSNRGTVTIYNCSAYGNGRNYAFSSTNPLQELIIKNAISFNGANSFDATTTNISNNSWNDGLSVSEEDFESLMAEELTNPRQADGSLPEVTFMNLVSGSDLIDAGLEVEGVEFNGAAPDLGAFEF